MNGFKVGVLAAGIVTAAAMAQNTTVTQAAFVNTLDLNGNGENDFNDPGPSNTNQTSVSRPTITEDENAKRKAASHRRVGAQIPGR